MITLYVGDTVLYVGKVDDRSIPRAQCPHIKTKTQPVHRPNGKVEVRKVLPEEMERLWR